MEAIVGLRERVAGLRLLLGPVGHGVERAALALGRALDEDAAGERHALERACGDLHGLVRVFGGDLPHFGDMEEVRGAAAGRAGDFDGVAVREHALSLAALDGRHQLAQEGGKAVVGEADLLAVELGRRVLRVRDHHDLLVAIEERMVEGHDFDQGREAHLAGFQADVAVVQVGEQHPLARVRPERHGNVGRVVVRVVALVSQVDLRLSVAVHADEAAPDRAAARGQDHRHGPSGAQRCQPARDRVGGPHMREGPSLERLIAARAAIAELVAETDLAIPLFERLDELVQEAEAAQAAVDPIERAQAVARARAQSAIA
ncbi:hypothetical protein [Cereibacter johrii]|nr:hypothetical protein [Cereibacter johrii]